MKLIFTLTICSVARACSAVDTPNILGKDLASASPFFAGLDPTAIIAATPIPGVRRVLRVEDLTRIARTQGIAPEAFSELCFERATTPLTADQLLPILKDALGPNKDALGPNQKTSTEPRAPATGSLIVSTISSSPSAAIAGNPIEIEILDFIRTGVPHGTFEFTRAGLDANGLWRGHMKYDGNRSVPIWVKVRVTTEQTWVEAAQPLSPGKPIAATQLVARKGPRFPFGPAPIEKLDQALNTTPSRGIRSGEAIFLSMLTTPREIERGDNVTVEVSSGDARLSFDAVAESNGRAGESVLIRNPENGHHFQARVESKGKVSVKK
jgi:flagella basal body P-ring formation protein FlgA